MLWVSMRLMDKKIITILFSNILLVWTDAIVYCYFMPVCSIVKTITPRCRGRPDALLHEASTAVTLLCFNSIIECHGTV